MEVGVVSLKSRPVPRTVELPGRVVAYATAEVRPQVDGIVRKVAFREAGTVEAGDVLYELDDRKFQAAVAAAEAALKKAEAATAAAKITFDRTETLAATNAVSAQTLDDARSSLLQAEAEEEAAKAELETARINLDNTVIRAPIDGIIGVSAVSVGALVTANQTSALATIRQIDPVHVDLVDSSANLLRIRDEVEAGRLGRERGVAPSVTLTLENGRTYARKGEMKLAEMVVSETSGTFSLRATFSNPDRVLLPGMFVRAEVDLGSMPNAFLVPQRAVQRSASGDATLYVASEDETARLRTITTSGSLGNDWIVIDGVADGDRLVVDGFQKISDGAAIKPVEATIGEDGVVRQTISSAGYGEGAPER
ncbi:MAG: efflux RND transporter periplasmic adaptor subunit [Aquamicrobium sp.]|nr:efflux RND transporter periplasmic adaptor subunit [Aquamicrobium sp.]